MNRASIAGLTELTRAQAILVILLALSGTVVAFVSFVWLHRYYEFNFVFLASVLIVLFSRYRGTWRSESSNRIFYAAQLSFFGFLFVSLLETTTNHGQTRGLLFFVCLSAASSLVLYQCLLRNSVRRESILLAEIATLAILTVYSQGLVFSGPIGIDGWYHLRFATDVSQTGYVPAGESYSEIPLFHVSTAVLFSGSGLTPLESMWILLLVTVLLCVLATYLAARSLGFSQYSLLASFFVAVNPYSIQAFSLLIPNAFSFGLMLLAVALFLRVSTAPSRARSIAFIAVTVPLVMLHILTPVVMIVFVTLIAFRLGPFVSRESKHSADSSEKWILVLLVVTLISYWLFAWRDLSYLRYVIYHAITSDTGLGANQYLAIAALLQASNVEYYLYVGPVVVFLVAALVGITRMSRTLSGLSGRYALWCLLLLVFTFIARIAGQKALFPDRWLWFAFVFSAIPVAIGFKSLADITLSLIRGAGKARRVIALAVAASIILMTIITPLANQTDPQFFRTLGSRGGMSQSETESFLYLGSISNGSALASDLLPSYLIVYWTNASYEDITVYLSNRSLESLPSDSLLCIRHEIEVSSFAASGNIAHLNYDLDEVLYSLQMDRIFSSGTVDCYVPQSDL